MAQRSQQPELRGAGEPGSERRCPAAAVAGRERRHQPVRERQPQRQQHEAGSPAHRLRLRGQLEARRPLHPRPERNRGARRTVLRCRGTGRGSHVDRGSRKRIRDGVADHPGPGAQ